MKLQITIGVLSAVLVCLLIVASAVDTPDVMTQPSATETVSVPASSEAAPEPSTQAATQSSSIPVTLPATQAETQAPTQPTTVPPSSYSDNDTVNAFVTARINLWTCPVKDAFGEVTGSREFASSRGGGKRAHAGLDFVAPHGTKVYAITSGTVQRVALFYQNTVAVEVLNDDGSILRYCEIATKLETGDYIQQGELVGTILRANSGTEMLHMEVYLGDGEGMLTQSGNKSYKYVDDSKNYMRRDDLLDPTFLKDLPVF